MFGVSMMDNFMTELRLSAALLDAALSNRASAYSSNNECDMSEADRLVDALGIRFTNAINSAGIDYKTMKRCFAG